MTAKATIILLAKYFLHGLVFSILASVFGIVWTVLAVGLFVIGSFLGIVIALVLLAVFYGFANSVATRLIWFPVRKGIKIYLGQGLLLGIILGIIEIIPLVLAAPTLVTLPTSQYIAAIVALNAPFAFVDGVVGKAVGGMWRESGVRAKILAGEPTVTHHPDPDPKNPENLACPRCRGTRLIVEKDRSAYCIDCKRGIHPSLWSAGPA